MFGDDRAFSCESFNQKRFAELTGVTRAFVQCNHSKSTKGVLRGLHYQIQQPQGKLVRVTADEVFGVAVDLSKSSPTFGHWTGATFQRPTTARYGFLKASPMASWSPATALNSSTKRPITGHRNLNVVPCGMTRQSASTSRWMANRSCRAGKTRRIAGQCRCLRLNTANLASKNLAC